MIGALFMDEQVILAATDLMHNVTTAMNLATLCRTAPTGFLCQAHHTTQTGLIQGNDTPTPKGTNHTPPTMGTYIGNISTNHNNTFIPTATGAAAVSEGTHHALHPATTVDHATLWPMDAPIATCAMTHPTCIVTPHPTLAISPVNVTHATIPWTKAGLTPATLITLLMRKAKPCPRPSTLNKSHHSKTVVIQNSPSDSSSDSDNDIDPFNY